MAAKKIIVHAVKIEDKPGSLYHVLAKAAAQGVDFNCLSACTCADGTAMTYLSAKNYEALKAWANKESVKLKEMAGFMISGEDKVGAAAEDLKQLADAKINGVAAAAMICDSGYGMVVIVNADDADAAAKALDA